jgi:hypothetical protein
MKGCRVYKWDMYTVYKHQIYIDTYTYVFMRKCFFVRVSDYLFMYASNKQRDKCMLDCSYQCALTQLNPQHINVHCMHVCGTHVIKVAQYKSCT